MKVGMCADIALHDKNDGNPHAHILLTMRPLTKIQHGEQNQKKNISLIKMEKK